MKNLIFFTTFLFFKSVFSQQEWVTVNDNFNITTGPQSYEMLHGMPHAVYTTFDGTNYFLHVDKYDFISAYWSTITTIQTSNILKIKSDRVNDRLYIATYDNIDFKTYIFENNTISTFGNPYNFPGANQNWEFSSGTNQNEVYFLYSSGTGPSDIHGLEYDETTSNFNHVSESTSSQDLSNARLDIQPTSNRVYFGVHSNKLRVSWFFKGAIATMFAYDNGLGEINSDGVAIDNGDFALIGDKNNEVNLYFTEDLTNTSFEKAIGSTSININTSSDPSTNYNISNQQIAKESSSSHQFVSSLFTQDGFSDPTTRFYVIRRDLTQAGTQWDTLISKILPDDTLLEPNGLALAIDQNNKHILTSYQVQSTPMFLHVLSNEAAYLGINADLSNSQICAGQLSEIYSNLVIYDEDGDRVRITDAYSLNAETSQIQIIPVSHNGTENKFKILGIPSQNLDQIVITYTDGYSNYFATLGDFQGSATNETLSFTNSNLKFCSNEVQIDLTNYVSYHFEGNFRLNGNLLNSTVINANTLPPTGIIRYTTKINNCFATATATFQKVNAPSIQITSNNTLCSDSTGSATAFINLGSSTTTSFYWSTGETNLSINNLSAGTYYANVEDGNNCKATKMAIIQPSDVSVVKNITNETCPKAKDGSVNLEINSSENYGVIWLNGQQGLTLNNLSKGTYEFSYISASGCQFDDSIFINGPDDFQINFSTISPDCNSNNGSINATVTGGNGGTQYLWNNNQTTAILTGLEAGKYVLTITDNANCTYKDSNYLNSNNAVSVIDSIINPSCFNNDGSILLTLIEHPLDPGINSITWSNGETSKENTLLEKGTYSVTINSGNNCVYSADYILLNQAPAKNDICVVSVDLASSSNLIVWEKNTSDSILYYNIYRENSLAGTFNLIDTVQYTNLSVFNDVIANPLNRSWRYRISPVNECLVEGPFSTTHKTLHLNTIEQVGGNINVYWDNYEGIGSGTYVVYRFSDQNDWEALSPSVPFGATPFFSDTPPTNLTGLDYYVDFELAVPCTATWRAQDFNRSRSNREKGSFNPGNGTGIHSNNSVENITSFELNLSYYPNPFHNNFIIKSENENSIDFQIKKLDGKQVFNSKIYKGDNIFDWSNLASGVYLLEFQSKNENRTIKIIKD